MATAPSWPAALRVRRVLGGGRAAARRRCVPVLGARHDERLARPRSRCARAAAHAPVAAHRRRAPRVAMAALGGFIFYNTNILNHYRHHLTTQTRQARLREAVQARSTAGRSREITAVKVAVDLFPREQRVRCAAITRCRTATGKPDRRDPPGLLPRATARKSMRSPSARRRSS